MPDNARRNKRDAVVCSDAPVPIVTQPEDTDGSTASANNWVSSSDPVAVLPERIS